MLAEKTILALEPYYGGSHKAWIDEWRQRSRHEFDLLTLPPRAWKWRMHGAAIAFAEILAQRPSRSYHGVLATDMMNVAEFLALTRPAFDNVPVVLYFHENQFGYPLQPGESIDFHYGFCNYISMLAATRTVFNSAYNRQDFFMSLRTLLARMPDCRPSDRDIDRLEDQSWVIEPAIDLDSLHVPRTRDDGPPIILWNHRWEYDKAPERFIEACLCLQQRDVPFRLIICGEAFQTTPPCLLTAREQFGERLIHLGYAPTRRAYAHLLARSDIVVSTAVQEYFGISVVEAMYAGAFPLLPNRLNYPALIPPELHSIALYEQEEFADKLEHTLHAAREGKLPNCTGWAAQYNWPTCLDCYDSMFDAIDTNM